MRGGEEELGDTDWHVEAPKYSAGQSNIYAGGASLGEICVITAKHNRSRPGSGEARGNLATVRLFFKQFQLTEEG